jgi:hypothetical protein
MVDHSHQIARLRVADTPANDARRVVLSLGEVAALIRVSPILLTFEEARAIMRVGKTKMNKLIQAKEGDRVESYKDGSRRLVFAWSVFERIDRLHRGNIDLS